MLYLVAHCVGRSINYDIAERIGDHWYSTIDESRLWPYWTQELPPVPTPPDGWDDYLADEAVKFAVAHRSPKEPGILAQLGIVKHEPKVNRR